ncbi:MAG: hypothetical protein J5517_05750 [Eubacterium sp.]|nr:hypothetical protein [Eubacterium sp.]
MDISQADWLKYKNKLASISQKAADEFTDWIISKGGYQYGDVTRDEMIRYAYALSTKYGEATASLAAEMYDETAALSKVIIPAAEVAETATYSEVAKAINGILKTFTTDAALGNVVGRFVKMAGADTILKNAERDGAQFAWIPAGDTCVFCLTLASNGWKYMSKNAMKNGHASHIHANCDCTFAVRFDNKTNVKGYNPDKYKAMYNAVDGKTSKDKINSMRRIQYQENKDRINAQKRANYNAKKLQKNNYLEKTLKNFNPISSNKAINIARKESVNWINNLSDSAKLIIKKYTYNQNDSNPKFYERINSFIRNGYKGEKDYTEQINILSNALKSSKLHHDYICYRGSDFNPFEGMKVGDKKGVNQFFSTSLKESSAFDGKYKIIVFAPEGTNAGYIESLSDPKFKNQREMLFDKDVLYELLCTQGNDIIVRAIP